MDLSNENSRIPLNQIEQNWISNLIAEVHWDNKKSRMDNPMKIVEFHCTKEKSERIPNENSYILLKHWNGLMENDPFH